MTKHKKNKKDKKNKTKKQPSNLMLNRQAAIEDMEASMLIMNLLAERYKVQSECEEESETESDEQEQKPSEETSAHS